MTDTEPHGRPEEECQGQSPETAEQQAKPEGVTPLPVEERKIGFPSTFARLFFGAITLLVIYYSYLVIKPYLLDIFLAFVIFFVAKPLYLGLVRLFGGMKLLASLVTCLILAIVILAPLAGLASIVANQTLDFSYQVSQGLQSGQFWHWISTHLDQLKHYLASLHLPVPSDQMNLQHIVQTVVNQASAFIYNNAINLIKGFTFFFLNLVLVLFIAFFMFLHGDAFIEEIRNLSPLDPTHNEEILRETENTIKVTVWGTVIVAFVQGVLGGVGFLIFGLPQPAFWGTVMIPASVIPLVGSSIIWGPAAIYLLFTGSIGTGVGLILWGGVLVSIVDNVLRPLIVKGHTTTPSVLILFSILGGLEYFGIIGFILGPLILSFLLSLLRIYRKTFLPLVTSPPLSSPSVEPAAAKPGGAALCRPTDSQASGGHSEPED
ncbi:MAG: AI-2E family transporter [Syntrophobacterales bacterium]